MDTAVRLWPLPGASITIDLSLIVLGQSGPIDVPIPAFLIEHERGLVLFDTGLDPAAWEDTRGVYGPLADMFGLKCPPENKLVDQLALRGFKPEDVTHVVISHAHFDHTGGMYLFPHADFYMSEADLRYAYWPDKWCEAFFRREDLERTREFAWHPLTSDLDLFGDGSIQLLQAPGHTHGELSMLLKLPSRSFLLTADAVHVKANLGGVPCPVDLDGAAAHRSIERIKQISASHGADIWIMHDPEDWAEYGGAVAGLA